jgi:NhaP-type Na+/H+ or K+/H+ antiporter
LASGLLKALTWQGAALGLLLVLVVRPLGGMLTLAGSKRVNVAERAVISFFGIRGIGSIFYLAFALHKAEFAQARELWAILGFTMLVSIVLHGVLATPVMNWLDRRHGRKISAELADEEKSKEETVEATDAPEPAVK